MPYQHVSISCSFSRIAFVRYCPVLLRTEQFGSKMVAGRDVLPLPKPKGTKLHSPSHGGVLTQLRASFIVGFEVQMAKSVWFHFSIATTGSFFAALT